MPFGFLFSRSAKMTASTTATGRQEIDVEDVLSKLNLEEKISLLSGMSSNRALAFGPAC